LPRVTVRKTKAAASGTMTYFEKIGEYVERIGEAEAIPANSAAVFPRSPSTKVTRTQKVTLTPKFSRMRSARPLVVTAPMRAHISWVTTRAIVTGMRSQRRL